VNRRSAVVGLLWLAALLAGCGPSAPGADPASPLSPSPRPLAVDPAPKEQPSPAALLFSPTGMFGALSQDRYLDVWGRPSGSADLRFRFDTTNDLGRKVPFLIADTLTRLNGSSWLKVYLPIRPNDGTGWVHAEDVRLIPERQEIVVDLSERRLEHFVGGVLVDRFHVGVGLPQTPTATGTFFVVVRVRYADPSGSYGSMALGLSGFSDVLTEWPGGGRMVIHGTSDPSDPGHAVSHGCIRVFNPDLEALRHVPLGTPVIIKR